MTEPVEILSKKLWEMDARFSKESCNHLSGHLIEALREAGYEIVEVADKGDAGSE